MTTPAVAGLPKETLSTLFNMVGLPDGLSGKQIYAQESVYNQFDKLIAQNLGEYGSRIGLTYGYDNATGRQNYFNAVPELKTDVYRLGYAYNNAGMITSITDTPDGGQPAETQCFQYDGLQRLTEAWAQTAPTCPTAITTAGTGGPVAYWRSYTYEASGNRKTEVNHQATATTRTYGYPAAGGGPGSKPHAATSVASTGGSIGTLQYGYDKAGNMTCRPSGTAANACNTDGSAGAASQTISWNDEGRVAKSTDAAGETSYTYDADGGRLIRRDPAGTTLYLPNGLEIRKPASGSVTGTRYYSFTGSTIAVRTPTTLTWLINDHQGTANATVTSDASLAVVRRRTLPFGEMRGTPPASWAGDKGFVGGTQDNTGLTHLGAREYDPMLGRFISVDPLMDLADPLQWGGYNYSNDSPISKSDPTGLMLDCGTVVFVACGASTYNNTGGKGGSAKSGSSGGGRSSNGGHSSGGASGNQAAHSPSGNVAQSVPVVAQKEKCGRFAAFCNGWQRSWDWVHANRGTLAEIALDLAELDASASLMLGGGLAAFGGGLGEVASLGFATPVAVPVVVAGAIAFGAGALGVVHGGSELGKDLGKLHWNNQADNAAAGGKGVQGASGTPGGHAGRPYELRLKDELHGEDGFQVGGRDFDGKFVKDEREVWYEAKSGNAWDGMLSDAKRLAKFKSNTGDQKRIASANDADFKVYSDVPIPGSITKWLDGKSIPWEVR